MICAPEAGTLSGKAVDEVNPAGKLPRLTVGVALVPVTVAFTVMVNVVPAETVKDAGEPESARDGGGDCDCWDEPPPPQPVKMVVAVRQAHATARNRLLNKEGTKISPGEER